jgi:hypothetical protein
MPFSRNRSFSYLGIAFVGLVLIALPAYAEFLATEFNSAFFESYLNSYAFSELWWRTFAMPVLAGVFFLIAAAVASRVMRKSANDLPLLAACVLLSGVLVPFVKGVAIFALVVTSVLLATELTAVFQQRQSRSDRQ